MYSKKHKALSLLGMCQYQFLWRFLLLHCYGMMHFPNITIRTIPKKSEKCITTKHAKNDVIEKASKPKLNVLSGFWICHFVITVNQS